MLPPIDYFYKKMDERLLRQIRVPDKILLSKWLKIAMGPISLRKFSEETGLNVTFLSRVKNCQIDRPLKIEELYAIASHNHADKEVVDKVRFVGDFVTDIDDDIMLSMLFVNGMDWVAPESVKKSEPAKVQAYSVQTDRLNEITIGKNALLNTLLTEGYEIKMVSGGSFVSVDDYLSKEKVDYTGLSYSISGVIPKLRHFQFYVENKAEWNEFKEEEYKSYLSLDDIIKEYGTKTAARVEKFIFDHSMEFTVDYIEPEMNKDYCNSIIVSDMLLFEAVTGYLAAKSFNNSYSIILIDITGKEGRVVKEKVLNRKDGKNTDPLFGG